MTTKINELPSLQLLNECFLYDEENGILIWKERPLHHFKNNSSQYKRWNKIHANKIAGYIIKDSENLFYYGIRIFNKTYLMHRIIFKMFYGYEPDLVDHINGDSLDNKPTNLRSVNFKENARNRKISKNNKTGIIGISITKNETFRVEIDRNLSKTFKTLEEAKEYSMKMRKDNFHENHGRNNPEQQTILFEPKIKIRKKYTKSKVTGVHYDQIKDRWIATKRVNGKRLFKSFRTEEEAIACRMQWNEIYDKVKVV